MAEPFPEWLAGLGHQDFLLDGYPCSAEAWAELDWHRAYMDLGPSPAGNIGPYWHVPRPSDETVHRLYPKVLRSKWLLLIRRAIAEAAETVTKRQRQHDLTGEVTTIAAIAGTVTTAVVRRQLAAAGINVSQKRVANTLDYLVRCGKLQRTGRGRFRHPRMALADG